MKYSKFYIYTRLNFKLAFWYSFLILNSGVTINEFLFKLSDPFRLFLFQKYVYIPYLHKKYKDMVSEL